MIMFLFRIKKNKDESFKQLEKHLSLSFSPPSILPIPAIGAQHFFKNDGLYKHIIFSF